MKSFPQFKQLIPWLGGVAAVGGIAYIIFQFNGLEHGQTLLEKQFLEKTRSLEKQLADGAAAISKIEREAGRIGQKLNAELQSVLTARSGEGRTQGMQLVPQLLWERDSLRSSAQEQNDSLKAQIARLSRKIESVELQNDLLIKTLEAQLAEAERKSRFLEIVLAALGGLLGIIVAVITFANIWQGRWERRFHDLREDREWGMQEKRDGRESHVIDALRENVETVTNLMQIISEGQKVAAFVKESVERQNVQFRSFKDEIIAINAEAEGLMKEGKLKRREVRQREVQGEIDLLGNLIEKKLLILPLVPFDPKEESLSSTAFYVRALQAFLNSNYEESRRVFKEARHLPHTGDLLWQIPFYEGMMAKNEGNFPNAISLFEEAINARAKTDPELGSQAEIAEIICFRGAQGRDQNKRLTDLRDSRERCLRIILKAEEGSDERKETTLANIEVGKNPNMTDEFRRLQARCFLIAGNSYWIEGDFENALRMYKKSSHIRQASVYAFSSVGQALDKLQANTEGGEDSMRYYEKAFSALHARLGRFDEAQNRILRASVFALCIKRLRTANAIEAGWEPIQFRIEAERIVEDELKFKNRNIRLFSPISKTQMEQGEFLEELRREIG